MLARTPGTQKGSPFSLKGGRTKYNRQKEQTKELGMETCLGEGVMEEKLPNGRKPSHWWVCGEFGDLRGQHNWEGKRKKPTEYAPNCNSQRRSSPDARSATSEQGLDRDARAACVG